MKKIKSVELQERDDDIKNYVVTYDDGTSTGVEAKSEKEARAKVEKIMEANKDNPYFNGEVEKS